ncbi:MAG: guanylate kinase, partial [Acidimicrobiia bacterium]
MVSGPSGAGKSSVVAGLQRRRPLYFSVSVTTRDQRPGEIEGSHYYFISPEEFARMIANGEFLEWAEYSGRLYGTPLRPVVSRLEGDEDVLLEIEVQGARQIREIGLRALMFFIIPPSLDELAARLRRRGDTNEADITRRLRIAADEMEQAPELFDHIVVNDDLDRCIEEVDAL